MEYNNLLELIKTVSESNITNFKYEEGDMKIHMSSGEVVAETYDVNTLDNVKVKEEKVTKTIVEKTEEVIPMAEKTPETKIKENIQAGKIVTSPLVGTFYAAPSEDSEPFVCVGDTVKKGQTLAIVEAMKLMNEIESEYDGVITEVYVSNGEGVEYGQPLFAIA